VTTRVVQIDPGPRAGPGGDVAADDVHPRPDVVPEPGHHLHHAHRVPVRGVHHDHVDTGVHQGHRPLVRLLADPNGGPAQQAAVRVLGGLRVLLGLDEILDGDQAAEFAVGVHQRQFLDLVLAQQAERGLGADPDRGRDQRHRRHHFSDGPTEIHFEAHVPVGDDAQ
jgi:hypothetical protein